MKAYEVIVHVERGHLEDFIAMVKRSPAAELAGLNLILNPVKLSKLEKEISGEEDSERPKRRGKNIESRIKKILEDIDVSPFSSTDIKSRIKGVTKPALRGALNRMKEKGLVKHVGRDEWMLNKKLQAA
jgi:hypothetical protein